MIGSDFQNIDPWFNENHDPASVLAWIRENADAGSAEGRAFIYTLLRSITWKLLTGREYGDRVRGWYDVCRQSAAICIAEGGSGEGAQIRVLSDLLIESKRFGDVHSLEAALKKQHVRKILNYLNAQGGSALRADLREEVGLMDSNLSRVILNLSAAGLIDRKTEGRNVVVSITELAKDLLNPNKDQLTNPNSSHKGLDILVLQPDLP